MARILKGAELVEALNASIESQVMLLKEKGIEPTLAILGVGERGDDASYERGATRRAESLGVTVRSFLLPSSVSTEELIKVIEEFNADQRIHGVLVLRPLPEHIDENRVCNTLAPSKDIDGITNASLAGTYTQNLNGYAPCTAQACLDILDHFGFELEGKKVVVIGRSLVVGKPVAMLLLARNCTVTIAHSRTLDLQEVVREADIVIASIGRAQMIDASYLSPGQVIIDVGINVTDEGSLVGDVNTQEAATIVEAITPVPGGVGTVTTSVLIRNVVDAASQVMCE